MAAEQVVKSFNNDLPKKEKHDVTDGKSYYYRGNRICWKEGNDIYVDSCGFMTNTTKNRLNKLGFRVIQKKGQWYLNGKEWNGQKIKV